MCPAPILPVPGVGFHGLSLVRFGPGQLGQTHKFLNGEEERACRKFFPAARQGEAMNIVNAKYGSEPGLQAYTHANDRPEASRIALNSANGVVGMSIS